MIFTKNKEGVRAIRAMKYKKYVAGTYTRARAPLVRKYTDRIFESKGGTTSKQMRMYLSSLVSIQLVTVGGEVVPFVYGRCYF